MSETKQGLGTIIYNIAGDGSVQGFEFGATKFFYMKNVQGDIIGITDVSGTIVAEYQYDSWGKLIKITDQWGYNVTTNMSHIGNINPLRYRGYCYDEETGWYYLQSRYYDPVTGSFLNADNQINDGLLGTNLFAYCENNPVNMSDPMGNAPYIIQNGERDQYGVRQQFVVDVATGNIVNISPEAVIKYDVPLYKQ